MTNPGLRALLPVAAAIASAIVLAGCQSSAQKSAELEKTVGGSIANQKGVTVNKQDPNTKVVDTYALSDEYAGAAVVEIQNKSEKTLVSTPIAIDVLGKGGKSIFKNDVPGLETALTSIAAIPAKASAYWVYDQIQVDTTGKPKKVEAVVGASGKAPASLPKIVVSETDFHDDVDGPSIKGTVKNDSTIVQKKLVIYGVAKRGSRVVAAGTSSVQRLAAGAKAPFQLFLVGKPEGAKFEFFAPPTVLR